MTCFSVGQLQNAFNVCVKHIECDLRLYVCSRGWVIYYRAVDSEVVYKCLLIHNFNLPMSEVLVLNVRMHTFIYELLRFRTLNEEPESDCKTGVSEMV